MLKFALLFLILSCLLKFYLIAENKYILQTGFCSAVTYIELQKKYSNLFLVAENSMIRIFNLENQKIIYSEYFRSCLSKLWSVHPFDPCFAGIKQEANSYKIFVYNWLIDKEIFIFSFKERPIYLTYSPQGTYLALCTEGYKSLYLLDSQTGKISKEIPPFGIVNFLAFSSKDNTILAYLPVGKICYWDLRSKPSLKAEVKTFNGLFCQALTEDRRYLFAYHNNLFKVIDTVTGKQVAELNFINIKGIASESYTSEIFFWQIDSEEQNIFFKYEFRNNKLKLKLKSNFKPKSNFNTIYLSQGTLYLGSNDGEIYKLTENGCQLLIGNFQLKIKDLVLDSNSILITGEQNIFLADFFQILKANEETKPSFNSYIINNLNFSKIKLGYRKQVGFYLVTDKYLYLLSMNNQPILRSYQLSTQLIKQIFFHSDLLGLIEEDFTLKVFSLNNFTQLYSLKIPNIHMALFLNRIDILAILKQINKFQSPLMFLQKDTRKVISIPPQNIETFDYNSYLGMVFFLMSEEKDENLYKTIKASRLTELSNLQTIYQSNTAKGSAQLISDLEGPLVFFSFGESQLFVYNGFDIKEIAVFESPIEKLGISFNYLYGVHKDSSLSIWDKTTFKLLYRFFIFSDLSWICFTHEDKIFYVGEIDKYITIKSSVEKFEIQAINHELD